MPVIVNARAPHPFLPSLGDPAAIEAERARHQDIRPMEIAIINLMADKIATEKQLAYWLGNTMLQVNLTFTTTDHYVDDIWAGRISKNTPPDHIRNFYNAWSDIRGQKFDGLIVTGVNALKPTVGEEDIWPEVQDILDWSQTNVFSSLFLCWGAKAALKHFHNIESVRGKEKIFGLYEHRAVIDKSGLLAGFPDSFSVPISRWKSPLRHETENCAALEIVADCEIGPNIMAETGVREGVPYPRRVYILSHPEYATETLKIEYERDRALNPSTPLPLHYFPNNDPKLYPRNSWRHTAHIYTNWIKTIYEATPYNVAEIAGDSLESAA